MNALSLGLLGWGSLYASTVAYAILGRRRAARRRLATSPHPSLPWILVRPCAGAEPALEEALRSSAVETSGAKVRFAVATEEDAATETARRVAADLRALGHDAEVILTLATAPNRKADQIARVLRASPACAADEVLVVADSDVVLRGGDLERLVSALADEDVGAAYSPFVERRGPGGGSRGDVLSRAVLGSTLHAFALLAALDPAGLVGKCCAVRRARLEALGGFEPLSFYLGEDMELARRLRAVGYRVAAVGQVEAAPRGRSAADALERYTRWLLVIRAQRPWLLLTYPAFFFGAFPLALVSAFRGGASGALAALLFLLPRLAIAREGPWIALQGDAVLAVAFVRALFTRRVHWRGVVLRVGSGDGLRL